MRELDRPDAEGPPTGYGSQDRPVNGGLKAPENKEGKTLNFLFRLPSITVRKVEEPLWWMVALKCI